MSEIRTPDQRLRVFVSSTLKELAEERRAAQRAISNLRLIPVMFELGARSHPSDQLYQAYLEQSQIFIGIYYQQYGWIGPGKEISGIEDEYLLAAGHPRLIYLKSPAPDIESGLKKMIRGIQSDNTVSYKRFSEASELQELIENDLAVLLTEQFFTRERIPSGDSRGEPVFTIPHQARTMESKLPDQPTKFIGREQELAEVIDLLAREEVRLVTLYGPGGTGKTRLSLKIGENSLDRYKSGVVFIPLAEVNHPDLLVSKIAQQLGIREGGSQPLLASLKNYLRDQQILLIMDNFEQIVQGADLIPDLLAASPGVKILITSRTLLNLRGEYEYLVPPLKFPGKDHLLDEEIVRQSEAVQLFSARASAAAHNFKLDEKNLPVIAEICYQLDGLPLAIELAAARIKLLTPEMILERLSGRLDFLTGGARDLPERQQTLRNTLDWSFSLLDQGTQTLFAILGVFVGGFTLEAAEAVCAFNKGRCELEVLEGLQDLLENSLLRRELTDDGEARYRMLEIIRTYALEKLASSGNLEAVRDQHAQYFCNKTAETQLILQTSASTYRLDWFEAEHDNLRATLAWLLEKPVFQEVEAIFLGSSMWFWFRRGYLSEGREWSQKVLHHLASEEPTAERALILLSSGALAMWQGDLKEAMLSIDQGLQVARWLEDPFTLAMVLLFRGTIYVNMGRDEAALHNLEEAYTLFEELGLVWFQADTQVHIANAALGKGEVNKALDNLRQAAALNEEIGETWLRAFIANNIGEVSRVRGEYDLAQSYYQLSETLLREMGDAGELARLVHNLGYVALHQGDYQRAEQQFQESLAMFIKLNNQRGIAESLSAIAGLWAEMGNYQASARLYGAAMNLLDQIGGSWWPADRVEINRLLARLEDELGSEDLANALEFGKLISMESSVSLAQREYSNPSP